MPVVHELSKDDCAWLLSTDRVGRLIYTAGALPAVAPVTYTIVDKDLLIHLEPDDDLMLSLLGRVVALQVDFVDRERLDGWQVTLTGKIHAETPGTSDRHTLRLVATIVSGRTVRLA